VSVQQQKLRQFSYLSPHIELVSAARNREIMLSEDARAAVDSELLARARNYCPGKFSCRNFKVNPRGPKFIIGVFALFSLIIAFPITCLLITMSWILLASIATTILRVSAIIAAKLARPLPSFLETSMSPTAQSKPRVTLLIPLFHEGQVLSKLIKSLDNLDYPNDLLEIKLLLEEVDDTTAAVLSSIDLPSHMQVLTVPKDWLQTKPKAMNYALPFCTGDIIGIYDAEDAPEPDQIKKVVNHFMHAPANVACVQGNLDFYNSRENWMARCFTIDYAMWFRVLLKGIQTLGIPIPLGGTTIFFRRNVLIEIGGWDAHNVTEDAELGMRLARFGYKCEMIDSTTWEEANCVPISWVRQRSRWLKGYAMTWASHMRSPIELWRDLGPKGFIGFQVIMLSGLTSHLSAPLFLCLWLSSFGLPIVPIAELPTAYWYFFIGVMIIGECAMLIVASMALWNRRKRHLFPYILALPFYWALGSLAAYKAMFEVVVAPFYWDKTSHGHTKPDQTLPDSYLSRIS